MRPPELTAVEVVGITSAKSLDMRICQLLLDTPSPPQPVLPRSDRCYPRLVDYLAVIALVQVAELAVVCMAILASALV